MEVNASLWGNKVQCGCVTARGRLRVEVNASLWGPWVQCGCVTARGRCVWRSMHPYGVTGFGAAV